MNIKISKFVQKGHIGVIYAVNDSKIDKINASIISIVDLCELNSKHVKKIIHDFHDKHRKDFWTLYIGIEGRLYLL